VHDNDDVSSHDNTISSMESSSVKIQQNAVKNYPSFSKVLIIILSYRALTSICFKINIYISELFLGPHPAPMAWLYSI